MTHTILWKKTSATKMTHKHLDANHDSNDALHRMRTAGSISISPELFEKLYLNPQSRVKGDLRKKFANPTPVGLTGFLVCVTPLAIELMGWRGAGGNGAATIGSYFWFGGLLMILGMIGEWVIGNTFSMVVFGTFGSFWLSWGATLQPFYNAAGAFATEQDPTGTNATMFKSSIAFWHLTLSFVCLIFLVCSLRTNIVFVGIFLFLVPNFACLAASGWVESAVTASHLHVAAGALCFVVAACGWWIYIAIMLASLDFPWSLPVGDLSHIIKGASERRTKDPEHTV
ncbi:hypothetical protein GQ43DRAFT_281485 [Delitschia confertaspora ATCC 74209]|uniref:GPR1/FUN34/YaaH family protein n=1 Tax=Delitschia confertaspora ATCC 74209 TaxID=1513339 RepID=A0A9P4JDW0_9PLEO|nr:hypothetical protein GQ43DRAFT_281485 [Delitschia confertaspora ATCC 74209]